MINDSKTSKSIVNIGQICTGMSSVGLFLRGGRIFAVDAGRRLGLEKFLKIEKEDGSGKRKIFSPWLFLYTSPKKLKCERLSW